MGLISRKVFPHRRMLGLSSEDERQLQKTKSPERWGNIFQEIGKGLELAEYAFEKGIFRIVSGSSVIELLADELHCADIIHFIGIPGVAVVVGFIETADLISFQKLGTALVCPIDEGLHDPDGTFISEF